MSEDNETKKERCDHERQRQRPERLRKGCSGKRCALLDSVSFIHES